MASLTGSTIASSYTSLLKLSGNADNIVAGNGSNAIQVVDGDGTTSPLYLNTDRLGIGGQPTYSLQVKTPDNGLGEAFGIEDDSSGRIFTHGVAGDAYYLKDKTANATRFYMNYQGKATFYNDVGIGVSPTRQLHVHGADGGQTDGLHITNTDTGATSSDGFTIGLDANENTFFFGRESGKSIDFYTNSVARFKIDDNSRISLSNNDGGSENTVFGYQAFNATSSNKDKNTAIGYRSLFSYAPSTDGDGRNTAVGYNSGRLLSTGGGDAVKEGCVFIGADAEASTGSGKNQIVIGDSATGIADNSVTLGNADVTDVYMAQDSGAYVHSQNVPNHVANTMSSPYYRFDGVDDYIDTGNSFNTTFVESFSISTWIKPNDGNPSAIQVFFGTVTTWSGYIYFRLDTNGALHCTLGTNSAKELATTSSVVFSDGEANWTHCVVTFAKASDTTGTMKIYANGVEVASNSSPGADWNLANYTNTNSAYIGARNQGSPAQWFNGEISNTQVWNKDLTATEVKELYSGASVPFKYKGANQTNLTSGTLVKGKAYRITTYNSNDDFTNLGASSNATGVEFVSTGTTPTEWLHSSILHPIGAVAEYDGSGIASDKWFDKSGNDLHGTITAGATAPSVENAPSGDDGLVYEEGTWSPVICQSDDTDDVLPMHSETAGKYVRIGNTVTVTGHAIGNNSAGDMTSSDSIAIKGLPYPVPNAFGNRSVATLLGVTVNLASGKRVGGYVIQNSSQINLYVNDGTSEGALRYDEFTQTGHIIIQATYIV